MSRVLGYVVMESVVDYEQILALDTSDGLPAGGVLTWASAKMKRAVFESKAQARAAITRTEHYRLAYGLASPPEKRFCSVHPVVFVGAGS